MITALVILLATCAWLTCGHWPGTRAAAWQYRSARRAMAYRAQDSVEYGRGAAVMAYIGCLLAGPLALMLGAASLVVGRSIPELVEAQAAEKRRELAQLQRDIDDSHRRLGLPPLEGR